MVQKTKEKHPTERYALLIPDDSLCSPLARLDLPCSAYTRKKVKAMGEKGDWRGALGQLDAAEHRAAATLAATLAAARTAQVAPRPEPMTVYMYTACITAMSKCKRWRESLAVLDRMLAAAGEDWGQGLTPNVNTMSAVITACGRCGKGKEALEVRREWFCRSKRKVAPV